MKFLKIFIITILIFLATVSGAALKIWELVGPGQSHAVPSGSIDQIASGDAPAPQPQPERLKTDPLLGTTNILLVGLDDLDGAKRSDAIAIAFVNQQEGTIGILSIPRDTRVQIQGHGWDKINHAYVFGGLDLLKQTIVNLTNITVNYHVVFNYDSFPRMIDLIGGVDLYVDKPMRYNDYSQKLFINIPQGQQHLDGKKSLEYVRFRHDPLGDIGRLQRQQKFMTAVQDKVATPFIIPRIPDLVREVVSGLNTDLTPIEAIRLATYAGTLKQGSIKFAMAPGKAAYIGSISYWVVDPIEQSVLIPNLIAAEEASDDTVSGDVPPPEPSVPDNEAVLELIARVGKIGILNGDGSSGLARNASLLFQSMGIDVQHTGNAKHSDYQSTNIIYPSENERSAAEALAELCGITNKALVRRDSASNVLSIILGHDNEKIFTRLKEVRPIQ